MRKFLFSSFLLALVLSACSGDKKQGEKKHIVFRYNELGAISSLDPAGASNFENIWAVNQLFNGLVQMDDSIHVKPCIAKSWELSSDGMTYIFNLRQDVFFQDNDLFTGGKGRKVVASDFAYSFERLFDKRISKASDLLDYFDRSVDDGLKGFTAINDSVFVVKIKKPFAPFLGILTMKFFSVVPHEVVAYYKNDFGRHPVGSGPFCFRVWKEGQNLVLIKNEHYFETEGGQQLPYLDAIDVSFIHDRESAWMNFLKGNIDLISGFDAFNAKELLTPSGQLKGIYKNKFVLQSQPFLKTDYLGFLMDNTNREFAPSPLKLKALRQAINYGIDREEMIRYLRSDIGTAAENGFVPQGLPGYDNTKVTGYHYDPEKAKQLMYLAGYPDGKGLPVLTLSTTKLYLELADHIRFQLNQIGIQTTISVVEDATFREGVANSKLSFFRKSWVADFPDPINFLALFYSGNNSPYGSNYTHFRNKHYDYLYEKAQTEQNDSLRTACYYEMERILIEEAPVVPLYHDRVIRLVQNNIVGLTVNSMNMLNLKTVKKIE